METACLLSTHSRHARSLARCADRRAKQRSIHDWNLRFCFQPLRAAVICGLIKVTQRCDKPHSTVRAPWNADIGQRYRGTSAGPVVLVPGAFPVPCPSAPKALASPRMYHFFSFPAPLWIDALGHSPVPCCLCASVPPRGCRRSSYRAAFLPSHPLVGLVYRCIHVSISALPPSLLSTVYSTQG